MTTDVVEFSFQCEPVHGGERQIQEQADPAIQNKECLAENLSHLLLGSLRGSGSGMVMERAEFPVHRKSTL
jgi:hypothetical protein